MATIKYKDKNGNLVSLGAGLHTHSPSSIGAADRDHGHDIATEINDGFLSAADKVALDKTVDDIEQLNLLVGGTPVNEQISGEIAAATATISDAANKYTDAKIANLINGAPTTLDTLGEIAEAMAENADVVEALDAAIGQKADKTHPHVITDVTDLPDALARKVPTTRTINGKALSANITLSASDVGAAVAGHSHDDKYYTESEIDALIGNTPVAEQLSGHASVMASTTASGHMSKDDKTKLDGIATGANNYTHPTTAGNKHIPSGGSSGQILRWSSSGTAAWGAENNTTYSNATQSADGLMSAADKIKLDGMTYTIDVKRDPNYVPGSGVGNNVITIVLPS